MSVDEQYLRRQEDAVLKTILTRCERADLPAFPTETAQELLQTARTIRRILDERAGRLPHPDGRRSLPLVSP
ncbi:MAG TPA: hypothetical protein VFB58_13730 [Chloroflexota bacterium]|nr:hypothetical protein [Chloroflexota bacterium]